MTSDYFYKFTDEQTMLDALRPLGMTYTDDEGNTHLSQGGHDWALWPVGEINGVNGFHINLRVINPELDVSALEPYMVSPKNPRCVWA